MNTNPKKSYNRNTSRPMNHWLATSPDDDNIYTVWKKIITFIYCRLKIPGSRSWLLVNPT